MENGKVQKNLQGPDTLTLACFGIPNFVHAHSNGKDRC